MKLNFCTLFNSFYLTRGIAMYQSLLNTCDDFHLYVFAFDDKTKHYLDTQQLKNVTVISLKEFEDEDLLRVKPTRTAGEYCWTSTSSTILYCITHFNLSHCTYIDADLIFYSNPKVLYDELGDDSVLITSHRYTPEYDNSIESGKYCVQFVTFKNDTNGMRVLNWWRNACIEWCYNRVEDGKFGDQKYLDDWQTRFQGVKEMQHLGGGIAPWNVQQYTILQSNNKLFGTEISSGKQFDIVFFHFHALKFYEDNIVSLTGQIYAISKEVQRLLFWPYVKLLIRLSQRVAQTDTSINSNGVSGQTPYPPLNFKLKLHFYLAGYKYSLFNISGKYLRHRIAHHYFYSLRDFKND